MLAFKHAFKSAITRDTTRFPPLSLRVLLTRDMLAEAYNKTFWYAPPAPRRNSSFVLYSRIISIAC